MYSYVANMYVTAQFGGTCESRDFGQGSWVPDFHRPSHIHKIIVEDFILDKINETTIAAAISPTKAYLI